MDECMRKPIMYVSCTYTHIHTTQCYSNWSGECAICQSMADIEHVLLSAMSHMEKETY